jgi:helicase required for RNAi-mediated heterochromatin assembly 1
MLALQKMSREPTPLQDYVVTPVREAAAPIDLIDLSNLAQNLTINDQHQGIHPVRVPEYVEDDPIMDLSHVTKDDADFRYDVVHRPMPEDAALLDKSQMDALHQILTKELALIQGPPGTGKTHVSVIALRIMLQKMEEQRQRAAPGVTIPGIIVACQTNHALDQLLRHIATFESSFIRLGGRSADTDVVIKRTLFNVMQTMEEESGRLADPPGLRIANNDMNGMFRDWKRVLAAFDEHGPDPGPMNEDTFSDYFTAKQIDSIANSQWKTSDDSSDTPAIIRWLGRDVHVTDSRSKWPSSQEFGFEEYEEEEEAVDEAAAEQGDRDDAIEMLNGEYISLVDRSVISPSSTRSLTAQQVKQLLSSSKHSDLNKVPPNYRLLIYEFLVRDAKQKIIKRARDLACKWARAVVNRTRGLHTKKLAVLADAKVIGCTSTGFAKYRPMIYALKPRIVLIEEAGECLEANMMSTFLPSLQHLILVGDHQQLRPRAQKPTHNFKHYDISLFERLACNTVDFKMLATQRRMPPEVRRLLWPIYGDKIKDHESTLDRPAVPGLKNFRSYFFNHENHEAQDRFKSTYNDREALLVVDFVNGLVSRGVLPEKITILTFYNAQRRLITRELKRVQGEVSGVKIKVATCDSYQGEENDIIVLSLVRNNLTNTVGFLSVANRLCVALSRARQGLFLFGNRRLLEEAGGAEWKQVIDIMNGQGPVETRFVTGSRITEAEHMIR